MAEITFWGRKGDRETTDALAFLQQNGYAPDVRRDIAQQPPRSAEIESIRTGLMGGLADAIDARRLGGLEPPAGDIGSLLEQHPDLWRTPILLTPRGALVGFREQKWRAFLDIGKGRR